MFTIPDIISIISDIASIANHYSPLITAIATVVLACLTWKYIQEIKYERRFRLKLEHTNDLKEQVIEPWIKQLREIRFYPYPSYLLSKDFRVRTGLGFEEEIPYCGEDLDVEEHHLFADLKNHLDAELLKKYEDFKNYCKKICEIHNKLRENLKNDELIEIDKAFNSLIDYLYRKKLSEKWDVDESKSDRTGYDGKDSQKRVRKTNFEIEIKKLLSNVEKKFEKDLKDLCDLIIKAKNCHESLLDELSKLRDYKIFKGECEFIRFTEIS